MTCSRPWRQASLASVWLGMIKFRFRNCTFLLIPQRALGLIPVCAIWGLCSYNDVFCHCFFFFFFFLPSKVYHHENHGLSHLFRFKLVGFDLTLLPWSCANTACRNKETVLQRATKPSEAPFRRSKGTLTQRYGAPTCSRNVEFGVSVNLDATIANQKHFLFNSDHALRWEYTPHVTFAGSCSGSVCESSAAEIFQWKPNKKVFETRIQEKNPAWYFTGHINRCSFQIPLYKQFVYCWFCQPFCKARTDADVAEAHLTDFRDFWTFQISELGELTWGKNNGPEMKMYFIQFPIPWKVSESQKETRKSSNHPFSGVFTRC